jgi:hypothetical protein
LFIAAGLPPPDVTAFNIAAYPTQEVNAQAAMAGGWRCPAHAKAIYA